MAHHQIHKMDQLRHEEDEREYAQSQECVGEYLAENVPVN
jgi:hypothetical protein